jgi:iron complex outermembrane receptor protein
MPIFLGAASPQVMALMLAATVPAPSTDTTDPQNDILVTASKQTQTIENTPNTKASIDADQIHATINATNIEDTLKYLPSLVIRKRHISDSQSPLATRTSGVGASARSLIYADGALLSSLIGNNNTSASPRWQLVSPQEVARIDVLYGPFSAAYAGNSIGAVVNITTRLPDKLEGDVTLGTSIQQFSQYGTDRTLPSYQAGATIGDRFGALAVFASYSHVSSDSQPLFYVTAARPASASAAGVAAVGGYADVNRAGAAIQVIGAGGFEHQDQDFIKLKAALDLSRSIRLTYVGGVFLNTTNSTAETYLSSGGAPVYSGTLNIAGYAYPIAASAFSNNVYRYVQRHWSNSFSATGTSGTIDWQVIGTLFDFAKDEQGIPTGALPGAASGGAGNITRLNGTGWYTVDAKAAWHAGTALTLSGGYHRDEYTLNSNRYTTSDWLNGPVGAVNLIARGRTQTDALWAQAAWTITAPLTLTVGGRQEWWQATDGYNFAASPAFAVNQPSLAASHFSPKASLAWAPSGNWHVSLSFGEAWRFPTVTELYQAVTTGPTITSPNPNLRPERALSEELAVRYGDDGNFVRLSLFNEDISGALLSQTAPLVPGSTTLYSYVQNVDRVRTYGAELAFQHSDILPGVDLSGSATLVDPRILADAAFPTAIGKRPPQVPTTKATIVATWRPDDHWSLTAAGRYASRSYGTIDNSDPVSFTYQGFGSYFVADLRAAVNVTKQMRLAFGVDNITDRRYFLFHPFPGRSFSAELGFRF